MTYSPDSRIHVSKRIGTGPGFSDASHSIVSLRAEIFLKSGDAAPKYALPGGQRLCGPDSLGSHLRPGCGITRLPTVRTGSGLAEAGAKCHEFCDHTLREHILWSLYRVFGRFTLAVATAVPIGISRDMSRHARGVSGPPIEFYRPSPPLACLPLTIIWFGGRRVRHAVPDLPGLLRSHHRQCSRGRAFRFHRADPRRRFDGGKPRTGPAPGRAEGRASGDPDRHARGSPPSGAGPWWRPRWWPPRRVSA